MASSGAGCKHSAGSYQDWPLSCNQELPKTVKGKQGEKCF
jgi:hypothetical protein